MQIQHVKGKDSTFTIGYIKHDDMRCFSLVFIELIWLKGLPITTGCIIGLGIPYVYSVGLCFGAVKKN